MEKDIISVHNYLASIDDSLEEGTIEWDDIEKDYMQGVSINVSNTEMFFNLGCKSRLSKRTLL
ncbi:hypothetical protein PQZ09_01975 [Methylophilaceae bacterium]|nr:hypothetical protein [Methylophilaceae bacterium]